MGFERGVAQFLQLEIHGVLFHLGQCAKILALDIISVLTSTRCMSAFAIAR